MSKSIQVLVEKSNIKLIIMIIMQKHELKSRISRVLAELEEHTGRGGIFYPKNSEEPAVIGRQACAFCAGCVRDRRAGGYCRNMAGTAAVQGYAVGNAWFFRCWLGLDTLVVPIVPVSGGEIVGVIEVGGFIAQGSAQETREVALSRLSSVEALDLFQLLFSSLQAIQESDSNEQKAVAEFLLEATFAEGLNSASFFSMRQRINEQQERLAAKVEELQPAYPKLPDALVTLAEILRRLGQGELHQARVKLDDFLGNMLLNSGQSLENAKSHFLILLSALACDSALNSGGWYPFAQRLEEQIIELNRLQDMESLCHWAENLILNQYNSMLGMEEADKRKGGVSDRVLDYLRRNYMRVSNLREVAEAVGASCSSIVHGLKQETGYTFVQHLTAIRVSEAKRLLAYSNLSLGEISRMCGFRDQSYFTKVFRREINLTPRQFRSLLTQPLRPERNSDEKE